MRDYTKVGGKKGKPGYRTPSRILAKKSHSSQGAKTRRISKKRLHK